MHNALCDVPSFDDVYDACSIFFPHNRPIRRKRKYNRRNVVEIKTVIFRDSGRREKQYYCNRCLLRCVLFYWPSATTFLPEFSARPIDKKPPLSSCRGERCYASLFNGTLRKKSFDFPCIFLYDGVQSGEKNNGKWKFSRDIGICDYLRFYVVFERVQLRVIVES